MKRLLFVLLAATLSGCNLDVPLVPNSPTDPATETFDASLGVNISQMTKTSGGAYYMDLTVGTGGVLIGQPQILFTYDEFVKNGALVASGVQTTPYPLTELPEGLQEGMQGMLEGGIRLVVVPSALGYGQNTVGAVGPNSTLIFKIRLDQLP